MNAHRLAAAITTITLLAGAASSRAQFSTTPTTDPAALAAALTPTGLTITSVVIRNGLPGQIGTYSHFTTLPITIRDGVVLSSGSVAALGPLPELLDPAYDPASPPPAVNSQMNADIAGGTPEFNDYGSHGNHIENFTESFDVAAIEVHFTIPEDNQIKFDFIFASVEYPIWTSSFTDAFLVFLDGTTPNDQIAFDNTNSAVQVGSSFAGLTVTDDVNTAFASPHGLIHHLTTTTQRLDAGAHTIIFEVGDVNDHILDSAAFITNLRAGTGTVGTGPSDDCRADFDGSGTVNVQDIFDFLTAWFDGERDADFNGSHANEVQDIFDFLAAWFAGCPGS